MENISETDIIITLITGTLLTFILAGFGIFVVIRHQRNVLRQREEMRLAEIKYQDSLLNASITIAEREREALAKNMHDDLGTLLSVIRLNQGNLVKLVNGNEREKAEEVIATNTQLLGEISETVKSMSNDLMSPTLQKLGLIRALSQLCNQVNKTNAFEIELNTEGIEMRFDANTEVQLFRICKEAVHNILKHSKSTIARIKLQLSSNIFTIFIEYNGNGINDEDVVRILENNRGLGLKSTYSRAHVLGASVNYYAPSGKNASVVIRMPVKEPQHA